MTKRGTDMLRAARERAGWRLAAESLQRQKACPEMDFMEGLNPEWLRYLHWQHLQEHPETKCACREANLNN